METTSQEKRTKYLYHLKKYILIAITQVKAIGQKGKVYSESVNGMKLFWKLDLNLDRFPF